MARSVAGVIVGYLVMFMLQFAAFMTIYTVEGANWSFKPGSFHASTRWTVMQFTVILVTAVIGGLSISTAITLLLMPVAYTSFSR